MPISFNDISLSEANQITNQILKIAESDGGNPVAVTIVDASGRLKSFAGMDGVVPASVKLSQSKAYSSVIGQKDTIHWASFPKNNEVVDFDMRNWTDENFSGFTGGVVILYEDRVIGGIGVSGRKGKISGSETQLQDNELAEYGRNYFLNEILKKS